jgi:hypothetical protein
MPRQIRRGRAAALCAAFLCAGVLAGQAGEARAGDIASSAASAEAALAGGNGAGAFEAIEEAYTLVWRRMPMSLRTALLVDSAAGFGDYVAHGDAPYRPGETVTVYIEPVGYGWIVAADGYRIALKADVEIRNPAGIIYAKADDFAELAHTSLSRNREFNVTLAMVLPQLRAGDYELRVTLRDEASPKSATAVLPLHVAADEPPAE